MFEKVLKFKPKETTTILQNMANYNLAGQSESDMLQAAIEDNTGTKRIILQNMKNSYDKKQISIAKVFLQYGLIDQREYHYLKESDNFTESVELILEIRKNHNIIIKKFTNWTMVPVYIIAVTIMLFAGISPRFVKLLDEQQERITNKIDYMWPITHHIEMFFIGISILIIYHIIIYLYKKRCNENVISLYKIFPLKAYEDMPILLRDIKLYKIKGVTDYDIATELNSTATISGMRKHFPKKAHDFKSFAMIFSKCNIPYSVVSIFQSSEKTDSLLKIKKTIKSPITKFHTSPIDFLIDYCENQLSETINKYEKDFLTVGLKKIFFMFSFMVIIAFFIMGYYSLIKTSQHVNKNQSHMRR